jgi:adenylate cyclase
MGVEIERKFLVGSDAWRPHVGAGQHLRQGYLSADADATVRVRTDGTGGWITIKGRTDGIRRAEFEYAIAPGDAEELMALCGEHVVDKIRYRIPQGARVWEIDEFLGSNAGLITAEIELSAPDEGFDRPEWLGPEVSHDPRYANSNLALRPFGSW